MKNSRRYFVALVSVVSFFCFGDMQLLSAQQTEAVKDKAAAVVVAEPQAASQSVSAPSEAVPALPVPRLIKVSGVAKEPSGQPRLGAVGLTFAIYKDQEGGAALWMETQNAELDAQGRYSVLLGSTQNEGMPLELFATGEPRWLGVQVQLPGEVEQPRVLLVSVPYALKASDADTVGGMPASAFILAPTGSGTGSGASAGAVASPGAVASSSGSVKSNAAKSDASKEITSLGTTNYIPVFTDNSGDLGNSTITEVNGNVGIGWTTPLTKLVIAAPTGGGAINGSNLVDQDMWVTLTAPGASDKYAFFGPSTATNLTLGVGLQEMMRITSAGNVGIGYKSPGSRLVIGAPSGGGVINASNLVDQDMWILLSAPGASDKHAYFGPSTATNLTLGVGLAEKMRITSAGRVGIGTSTPAATLDVNGSLNLPATASATVGVISLGGKPFLHNFSLVNSNVNTFVGDNAGNFTMSGNDNTGVGANALSANSAGYANAAFGFDALSLNSGGWDNSAFGSNALGLNTTGSHNTAVGNLALSSLGFNGGTGNSNIAIGDTAGGNLETGNLNIYIGNVGPATVGSESNVIRIGTVGTQTATFIAGISGATTGGVAVPVLVDGNGQLGTTSSSRRFKYDIHDMDEASNGLLQLRPVTFRYKQAQSDGSHPVQYGLIAEEVATVYPDLVQFDETGEPQTVLYHLLPAMLLNEVQKQHGQIEALKQENTELRQQLQAVLLQVRQIRNQIEAASAKPGNTIENSPAQADAFATAEGQQTSSTN